MNDYNKRLQPIYKLVVSFEYYDITLKRRNILKIDTYSVVVYEISKDSVNFNYNLHLLTLTNITLSMFNNFHLEDVRIIVNIMEDVESISNTSFRINKVHKIDEFEGKHNVQLVMVSEFVYDMINSNKYSKVSTFNTSTIQTYITSYQLISNIFSKISSDNGSKVETNLSNAGEVKNLYDSIRIPENLDDVSMFNWILEEYPPFLLKPYFIIDDFHIVDNNLANVNLFLLNICDINGSYQVEKYKDKNGVQLGMRQHMNSKPLMDYKKVFEELQATLMIKNENENKIYEIKPFVSGERSNKIIQIKSTLGIDAFKSKMYMRKKLAKSEASIETYFYDGLGLRDITFGKVYDVIEPMNFNHLPISLFYAFKKRQDNTFGLETTIDYIQMPGSLLTGIK